MANSPTTQQPLHSTIKGLNEAAKKKFSEKLGSDKAKLVTELLEGGNPGKAARDIRTALKNEERGKHGLLYLDDALDKAVNKKLHQMYDKVFEICKEENLVSYSKGGADKGVIDGAGQTMQYHQHPQSKLTRFAPPGEGLSQAVIIRCSKSGAYLTLGPPDGKPIEIVCPKELEKQRTFDIKYYQEQMNKSSHKIFTATSVDAPTASLNVSDTDGVDIVAATTPFSQQQQEQTYKGIIADPPTPGNAKNPDHAKGPTH